MAILMYFRGMKNSPWTEVEDRVLEDYAVGLLSVVEVAVRTGRSKAAVRSRAHKTGKTVHVWNIHLAEATIQAVAQQYRAGRVLTEIQAATGLSYHQVRWCLDQVGSVVDRSRAAHKATEGQRRILTEAEKSTLQEFWGKGWSIQALARALGCCRPVVARHIREQGWTRSGSTLQSAQDRRRVFSAQETQDIVQAYKVEIISQHTLAKRFGTSSSTLRRVLQAAGVDIDKEWRRKHSERMLRDIRNGTRKLSPLAGRGIPTSCQTPFQGVVTMRSRTEARRAAELDDSGLAWFYEVRGYPLSSGQNYLPDFWITTDQVVDVLGTLPLVASKHEILGYLQKSTYRLEDVKGWWRSDHPSASKIAAFMQEYPQMAFGLRIEDRKTGGWRLWP